MRYRLIWVVTWYEMSLESCRFFKLIWVVIWCELSLNMSCGRSITTKHSSTFFSPIWVKMIIKKMFIRSTKFEFKTRFHKRFLSKKNLQRRKKWSSSDSPRINFDWVHRSTNRIKSRGCEKFTSMKECTWAKVSKVGTSFILLDWKLPSDDREMENGTRTSYLQVNFLDKALLHYCDWEIVPLISVIAKTIVDSLVFAFGLSRNITVVFPTNSVAWVE